MIFKFDNIAILSFIVLLGFSLAVSSHIVNFNARLDVISVDVETDSGAVVFDRVTLHLDATGHQFVALEIRSDPVQNMVAGFLHIISYHILKGQHTLHIKKAGAGDQIAIIGVLAGELITDQMAAVIQIHPVNQIVIADRVPARWLDGADLAPGLGGHGLLADICEGYAAAAQTIQRAVGLKYTSVQFIF